MRREAYHIVTINGEGEVRVARKTDETDPVAKAFDNIDDSQRYSRTTGLTAPTINKSRVRHWHQPSGLGRCMVP
jgi:hypothetical protein